MDYSTPGFPVFHYLPEFAQTHAHWVSDEIQPVHTKGDQSWVFIGMTDAKAETPILWPPDAKNWLIGKDPDAGKDWRWEKGMTEDEMTGWHLWLDGCEFEWILSVGDGQGGLACTAVHGVAKSQTWLNDWTELNHRAEKWKKSHLD